MENDGTAVSCLGGLDKWRREMVRGRRGGSERVRLAVKFLRDYTDQFLVDALRAEVASNFLNAEEARLGRDAGGSRRIPDWGRFDG